MDWNIKLIEAMTEDQAAEMAVKKMTIKEYNVYFVDFGGYFGFSALVFKNGRHIHYCNDYELHHKGKTREELEEIFVGKMERILFTEEDFSVVKNYNDYKNKAYYLRNYYIMQIPYVSIFFFPHNEEEKKAREKKIKDMIFNPFSFCYVDPEYKDFCKHQYDLSDMLEKANEESRKDNFDYWKDAFLYEMWNHEYCINWQADYDVLSCFGEIEYVSGYYDMENYFDQLCFSDIQRKAYLAAKKEYYARQED